MKIKVIKKGILGVDVRNVIKEDENSNNKEKYWVQNHNASQEHEFKVLAALCGKVNCR